MLRKLGILVAAVVVGSVAFSALGPAASAQTPSPATPSTAAPADYQWPAWIQGRPAVLRPGGPEGWYFWHDPGGLHIATTTPSNTDHVFTAILVTDGRFRDVDRTRLEPDDVVRVDAGGHLLVARFHTYSGIDALGFRIAGGDYLRLAFGENGSLLSTSSIYVGARSMHPAANPFTVRRSD